MCGSRALNDDSVAYLGELAMLETLDISSLKTNNKTVKIKGGPANGPYKIEMVDPNDNKKKLFIKTVCADLIAPDRFRGDVIRH